MIPNRISLKGFLSYRDAVEFDFQGEPLWMLTGPNGSGKSAIFDAMTYALFGTHRLGSQNADELIHKEAEALEIVFEFEHAGRQYRIRRALRRAKNPRPSQQVFWRQDQEEWAPVEETEGVKELKQWVENCLGLRYETFTTSVLLLQGKAENLIAADPRDRRAVLNGVVEMQRYIRLHELIDEQRKRHRAERDAQEKLLRNQAEVSDADLAAVQTELEQLEGERRQRADELHERRRLEVLAERWPELQRQADELQTRLAQAGEVLAEAETIEAGWQRCQLLRELLPRLEAAAQAQIRSEAQGLALDELSEQEKESAENYARQEQARSAARAGVEERQRQADEQRARLQALDLVLAQQALTLKRLEALAQRRAEMVAVQEQLGRLPTNLAQQLDEIERAMAELADLRIALPSLTALHEEIAQEREATQRAETLAKQEPEVRQAMQDAEAELRQVEATLTETEQRTDAAQDEWTRARTRQEEVEQRCQQLETLFGQPSCSYCGQPLTAEHLATERQRLAAERAERLAQQMQAHAAHTAACRALADTRARRKSLQQQVERARLRLADHERALATAKENLQRCWQRCASARKQLPEQYRSGLTHVPSVDELKQLRAQASTLPQLQGQAKQLREQHSEQRLLEQKLATMRAALAGEPDAGPAEVARQGAEHERCQQERRNCAATLTQLEAAIARARQAREALEQACSELAARLATIQGARHEAARQLQEIETALRQRLLQLPAEWRELVADGAAKARTELTELEEAHIAERYQALQLARRQHADWQEQANRLAAEVAAIPAAARRALGAVQRERRAAEDELADCDRRHRESERRLRLLQDQRQRRDETLAELQKADRQYHLCERLAQLVGPKGLQLHLLREAERSIVELANEVIERISGGELTLELARTEEGDPAENPLQLQVRCRSVGPHPLHVAQLSGSQKFRVAVSLALAIGQYASRQPRTLEAVIIDEGFGCLDRDGRQVMIQELHQLKDQLRRIILVSHQEEFAETFPAGYQLSLEAGSTRARRM